MASTKITEFDLDPNMDMAHESTSQEILAKIESTSEESKPLKLFGGNSIDAGTGTALEITGKGELMNVLLYGSALSTTGYGILKVEIDGRVVIWTKINNSYTSSEYISIFFGDILSPNIPRSTTSSRWDVLGARDYALFYVPHMSSAKEVYLFDISAEMQEYTSNSSDGVTTACFTTKPIKFNEQLKITYDCTNMTNSTQIVGAYTLDEE